VNKYLKLNPEIVDALKNNKPVVALESTIISHGMPYPENVQTALECERIIREVGCIPATIAILNGELVVGLSVEEIDELGRKGAKVIKTSRRDLPYIVAQKKDGATTVSATMIIAHSAGIKFFATGGIGGVHRGAESSFDISADLEELAKTDVCVICAGAKAILDLEKTLEYLETKGVPVIGYQTNYFPAFYTRKSPYELTLRADSPKEIASLVKVKEELGLQGGTVVANPIPNQYSMNEKLMNEAIDKAVEEMEKLGIKGKETTPYLLQSVKEITQGQSLKANIQLVYNNCLLAAQIAKEYVELKK
jgi:pseudouridine-5'-phosphate glycosidase